MRKHVDHGTFRRKLRNWISRRAVDFRTCLADKFESFLHDGFICQRAWDAYELFMSILQSTNSTCRNSKIYWFLRIKWLCKMNRIWSSISSTLWQMNPSCKNDSNLSAKHLVESTNRRDIQFHNFRRNIPWSTCFHIGVVARNQHVIPYFVLRAGINMFFYGCILLIQRHQSSV